MSSESDNQLFPIFLRSDRLNYLIVGGGNVGWEKLNFMFRHSNTGNVLVVAPEIKPEIVELASHYPDKITLRYKSFDESDLSGINIVLAATNDRHTNTVIRESAKSAKCLVNVADTPDLCDFYLSSVVKKGDLKIAISSNGKSPTITKRIRELLEDVLPDELDDIIQNLNDIRDHLKGDFDSKVKKLDAVTHAFKSKKLKK